MYIKADSKKDFGKIVIVLLVLCNTLFQFGSLCFIGQRVTSASEDLMEATYECNWYKRDRKFKQMLLIIREMCKRKIEFGVLSLSFSHVNFKEVTKIIYDSFNTLSAAVKSHLGR